MLNANKGEYACIKILFELQRDLTNYINLVYIPSSLIVCLSFISFYIDHESAEARAPLGVTSIVTLSTMQEGININ